MVDALILVFVLVALGVGTVALMCRWIPWPEHYTWLRWALPIAVLVMAIIFFAAPLTLNMATAK